MKFYGLLLVSFIFLPVSILAQDNQSKVFPEDFLGVYKGELTISNPKGVQKIDMEFHLKQTDSIGIYQYTLVYIDGDNRQERLYKLVTIDADKGEFVVDENNGILLDAKWVDNTLYSMFEVQNNILTTKETFFDNHMVFEITFANVLKPNTSGTNGESSIGVKSYPITVVQKARLDKVVN